MDPVRAAVDPVLAVSGLKKRYGQQVGVDGVTLEVHKAEVYGLLGPNGAGKTTTIKLICGLLRPDAGEVRIGGRPALHSRDARAQIGYVPQEVSLYPDLTAAENLAFLGRLYGLGGDLLDARVREVLELAGLADRGKDRVATYSGGMRRRLNLTAGLINHPTLLVLDEPTVGVDPQSRHAILEQVRSFGAGGTALLYTTHYMEEAERICDRIGIIDHGRVIAEGTKRELVAKLGERDRIDLGVEGDPAELTSALRLLEGVEAASATDGHVQVLCTDGRHALPAILETSLRLGAAVRSVDVHQPDLEAVFLHLTGTALRE